MKKSQCHCESLLFFENDRCLNCGVEVGLCELCRTVTPLATEDGVEVCGRCGQQVARCQNEDQAICNVWRYAPGTEIDGGALCRFCQLTTIIPDLSITGNLQRWRALEVAKRRVLCGVEEAGFPRVDTSYNPPLSFQFKADDREAVTTGHEHGCITINIREADPVERERTRVEFGEPQRTLVGHFRHELGHYYWELLVESDCVEEFRAVFGDETTPEYKAARQFYYDRGPQADWQASYVSAYASMHPWEDFAETFATYLDARAILSTADHFDIAPEAPAEDALQGFESMLVKYQQLGMAANELNREMGLLDLVPEVFNADVILKLRFIDGLTLKRAAKATDRGFE